MTQSRINWIDWMKVIGLYTIILGHYSAPHYKFIYVFSVQLFFILSGYLFKPTTWKNFLSKTFFRMVVPLFILAILYNILRSTPSLYHKTFDPIDFIDDILGCFYGKQVSLGPCWFIYTLVLCQSIYQITKLKAGIIIAIVCLTAIQSYRYTIETITPNCITNTLLAFPVYMTGVWLQKYKTTFESMNNRFVLSSIISIGLIIVAVAGYYNGPVWMYTADSGGSVLLFMVGGVAGTSAIYALSKLLDNVKLKYLATIADGSIIILALHILVVYQSMKLNLTYGYYFLSLIVLIAFIPVIIFCKRYLPILTGYR